MEKFFGWKDCASARRSNGRRRPVADCFGVVRKAGPTHHCRNRKNFRGPEMGAKYSNWSPTRMGAVVTLVQAPGKRRFVVNCNLNPAALVPQARRIFAPKG